MTLEKIYNKWLSIQPLSEADQNKLSIRFTVEYNYNSNHLEGNTLTYGQTELLLLFGKVSGEGHLKDFNDMKASEVSVKLMKEEVFSKVFICVGHIRMFRSVGFVMKCGAYGECLL